MNSKRTMITGAVALAVLAPLAAFAATSSTDSSSDTSNTSGFHRHGDRSGSGAVETPFFGSGLTDAQKTELKTYFASIKTAHESMSGITLSDDDKASLKAIRDAADKAERDFLRAKGVTLPSEEAIASAKAIMESAKPKDTNTTSTDSKKRPEFIQIPGLEMGGFGGPGGHGPGGPEGDKDGNNQPPKDGVPPSDTGSTDTSTAQ